MKKDDCLTEKEAKEHLWKEFTKFMKGQTVKVNKKGKISYYRQDIDNFLTSLEKRFFD